LPKPEGDRSVIVLEESETGANDWFFDMSHSKIMSREQFVSEIKAGIYPSYSTRKISGVDYPVSKRDSSKAGLSPIA
jgi:hypothetical protein